VITSGITSQKISQKVEITKNTFVIFLEKNYMQPIRNCKTFITSAYSKYILLHYIFYYISA